MRARRGAAIASAAAVVAVAVVLAVVLSSGGSETPSGPGRPSVGNQGAVATLPGSHPRGVRLGCSSTSSEGVFARAFVDPRNLVVGPLVLVGATEPTSANFVRSLIADSRFGIAAVKFPLFVVAGHAVTVQIPRRARRLAGLGYTGRLPRRFDDTDDTINFVSCSRDESLSRASGLPITFWPGFLVTRRPACVPLDVYVADQPSPRHTAVSLGRRCRG